MISYMCWDARILGFFSREELSEPVMNPMCLGKNCLFHFQLIMVNLILKKKLILGHLCMWRDYAEVVSFPISYL